MPSLLNRVIYQDRLVTGIWGNRFGLDNENTIVGPVGLRGKVTNINTTIPTTVPSHGYVRVGTSGSSQGPTQHQLDAPLPGVEVTFVLASTSTGSQQFGSTAAGASIMLTSIGTTGGWINLLGPGGSVTLIGLTTAQWGVKSMYDQSSTAGVRNIGFSTST